MRRTEDMKDSLLARVVVVLLLLGLLLVPLEMIRGLVAEREARRRAAVEEIGATWGGSQTLVGPVLVLRTRVETVRAAFLPDRLKVEGTLVPERRRRGIFETVVYRVELTVSGTLGAPDVRALGLDPGDVSFADAFLSVGLTDTRGKDWALVLGAAALFAILAGVMFGTRRVDWWSLGAPPRRFSPPPVSHANV
ncbi:MAG TPA: inner membrane CreD family protein [Thermoanaerobaculia bacterium]